MQKFSRSRAKDPVQEKLRQSKDIWNKQTSEFIDDLIDFKKVINGKNVPEKNLPKVPIKQSFPGEVTSFLSELSSNALKIIEQAGSIISEQESYSKIKNNKQASLKEEELIKLANLISEGAIFGQSWLGSRLWSKIKMILSDEKKFSTDILDGCKELIDKLKNLENSCLSTTETSGAPEVFTNVQSCLHIFNNRIIDNAVKIQEYQKSLKTKIKNDFEELQKDNDDSNSQESSSEIELDKPTDKVSIIDGINTRERFLIKIIEEEGNDDAGYGEGKHQIAYALFTKLFSDPDQISSVSDKNKKFESAYKKTLPTYIKLLQYKEDPSGITFTKSDIELIDNLYSKYDDLISFYKRKIFSTNEAKKFNYIDFTIIIDKLQSIEESKEEDHNELILAEANSVSDLKNFLRKQWLNLKLDLKSATSTEKYNKEIINLSKSVREDINKLMVLIEDNSVELSWANIKNFITANGFKSNFPLIKASSYILTISAAMMDIANLSITYADYYKKVTRREEAKGTRYYRDISSTDIKETRNLILQMANLISKLPS